ncbi:MAG: YaiI/YqxD family protein [Bacillota bacterium]
MFSKIIIDADACPKTALAIARKVCDELSLELWTVASFEHNISSQHHIVVGNAAQEADIQIMNLTRRGDIVITQDWGLAAMLLSKGAGVISPWGKVFREHTIDFMLEEREMKARHRRAGGRTKGPRKRTPEDDLRFETQLRKLIQEICLH